MYHRQWRTGRAWPALLCLALLGGFAARCASAGDAEAIALPPFAKVFDRDTSGLTWEVRGTVSGALPVASADFSLSLSREGWQRRSTTVLARAPRGVQLSVWVRDGRRMLVMLWDARAGRTGFALGRTREKGSGASG